MKYSDITSDYDFHYLGIFTSNRTINTKHDDFFYWLVDGKRQSDEYYREEILEKISKFTIKPSSIKLLLIAAYEKDYAHFTKKIENRFVLGGYVTDSAERIVELSLLLGEIYENEVFIAMLPDKYQEMCELVPELVECQIFWSNVPEYKENAIIQDEFFEVHKCYDKWSKELNVVYKWGSRDFTPRTQRVIQEAYNDKYRSIAENNFCLNRFSFNDKTRKEYLSKVINKLTFGKETREFYHKKMNGVYAGERDNVLKFRLLSNEQQQELKELERLSIGTKKIWGSVFEGLDFTRELVRIKPSDEKTISAIVGMGREFGADVLIETLYAGVPVEDLI